MQHIFAVPTVYVLGAVLGGGGSWQRVGQTRSCLQETLEAESLEEEVILQTRGQSANLLCKGSDRKYF